MIDLTTAPLTSKALRGQVEGVVAPFGLSVDEFVASDVDDLPTDELRDVWMMVKGALALGLFVTLGTYSADALHLERTRQNLRLVNGKQLIDLAFEHYESLDAEWKRLLPLRRVYAVDRDAIEG